MRNKMMTGVIDKEFRKYDEGNIAEVLYDLGFRTVKDVMDMRIFDLLNMNRLSRNRAESVIYSLYLFMNPNTEVDELVYSGMTKQPLDYAVWRKKHRKHHNVLVRDLVLEEGMNAKALMHLMNIIVRAFFQSEEYNGREYAYYDFDDYVISKEGGRG